MSAPLERWEPSHDPIHRLILQFDFQAALTACHRWVPPAPLPPRDDRDCVPPPTDPDIHPPDILTAELVAAHADQAVALFVRYGQPAAVEHVHAAAGLMLDIAQAYRLKRCPCYLCPDCGGRPRADPSEYALAVLYAPTRQALLHHLALAGHAVPLAVRLRGARLTQLLRADALPPDPHKALRRGVGDAVAATPPPGGAAAWERAAVVAWVDKLAGPPGTAVRPGWRIERRPAAAPQGETAERPAAQAVTSLRPAWRAVLVALATAGGPLPGKRLAARAGYKPGSLRRHTKPMQDAGLIAWTPAGYELTPAGVTAAAAHTPVTYAVTTPSR